MTYTDPLKSEEEYAAARQRMEELKNARFGTPEGEELDTLHLLCHQFECERGDYEQPTEKKGFDFASAWYSLWHRTARKVPVLNKLDDALYWLRTHTYNRYHIINISRVDGPQGYRWGWTDADNQMLLACMKVFCDFYEEEYPGHVLWQPTVKREIEEIYRWWKVGRFEEQEVVNALYDAAHADDPHHWTGKMVRDEKKKEEWRAAFDAQEKRPQEMLGRLLAIRQYLWT